MLLLLIALGGALGSVARYLVDGWVHTHAGATFPWGTLVVNITGSLLLAFLVRWLEGVAAPAEWRGLLGLGFCGAYTTFSTFGYEAAGLMQSGQSARAASYVVASVVLSLLAVFVGFRLAAIVLSSRG
jgi:fluoride exporter